tara:strand:- start:103 stop:507 length:405 start_codon:yes stop_codon:yes gene_type:complete
MLNRFPVKKYKIIENFLHNKNFLCKNNELKDGLIYTLYSDKSNLIEVGFVQCNELLENKLIHEKFILLDKKRGSITELRLLKKTLEQLGLLILNNKYYKYTDVLIRHLNTLGWPVGNSLYKQRVIKKKISYAIN